MQLGGRCKRQLYSATAWVKFPSFSVAEFMTALLTIDSSATDTSPVRDWPAFLCLRFQRRNGKTCLIENCHSGPLRVQRPFYPEADGCAHVYLLHPPGGMVLGDRLTIQGFLQENTGALLTTPSAGKLYSVEGAATQQRQHIYFRVDDRACLEWLPQETIVYDGANGELHTRIDLQGDARFCAWDIVALGRAAAGERFTQGECRQKLEVWRDARVTFVEHNRFRGGDELLNAAWGLRGHHVSGTFLASVAMTRSRIDDFLEHLAILASADDGHHWGLTQKNDLFIARYLGDSAARCRQGFEWLWHAIRPALNQKTGVVPRIWRT